MKITSNSTKKRRQTNRQQIQKQSPWQINNDYFVSQLILSITYIWRWWYTTVVCNL